MPQLPIEEPDRDQESVHDYPRPPRLEQSRRHIRVEFGGEIVAETDRALRVLETTHPPTYYIPPEDVRTDYLVDSDHRTYCEFKGRASYFDVTVGDRTAQGAAWSYPDPTPDFEPLTRYIAFYPAKMDRCLVDGEEVAAQDGGFYGGWITSDLEGPFKSG